MGNPTYMYKLIDEDVFSEIFDSEEIPKGWHDCPVKAKNAAKKPAKKAKSNVNSTRADK